MLRRSIFFPAIAVILTAGCTGGGRQCAVGADCASGFCRADGTCAPAADGGAGGADGGGQAGADGGGGAGCSADHDDVITRGEVSIAAGRTATFRVATDAEVDTTGAKEGGERVWDLSGQMAGDHDVDVVLQPLAGTWFESDFSGATYAARLADDQDLLGVFEAGSGALLLRGVVSPEDGFTRTELTYDPPVKVLDFPLAVDASWETVSTVSGVAEGVAAYYTESYQSEVDAAGKLDTPYGRFPVQRVRTEMTRTVGAAVTTVRSFLFVAECYGTVANVVSQDYEPEAEFSQAAEVRRLAP